MELIDYVVVAAGAGLVGFGLLFILSGVQHYFDGNRITDRAITPTGRLESGPVAITGTARPADEGVLTAPFTGRECVAVAYRVRETTGKDDAEPFIAAGTETVPFCVDDGTGEVLVRPDAADLDLEWGTEIVVERDERPPEPIERFLSQRDDIGDPTEPVLETLWPSTGTRSFRERLIEAGDEVYVFGEANERPSKEFGGNGVEIRQGAKGGHSELRTFIVSDKPKAAVSGERRSGGRLAVLIGVGLVIFGAGFVLATPLV